MSVTVPSRWKVRSRVIGCAAKSDFVEIVWCIFKHGAEYFQRLCIPFSVAEGLTRTATPGVSSSDNLEWDFGRRVVRRVTLRDLFFIKGWAAAVRFGLRGWLSYTSRGASPLDSFQSIKGHIEIILAPGCMRLLCPCAP